MIRKLAELQSLCKELGLEVRIGPRKAKADYLLALREHYLRKDYLESPPFAELTPMLSFPYWNLKAPERERIWGDHNDWIVQEKFNGCRVIVHFVKGIGTFAHSRNIDTTKYRRTDLTYHLLFADLIPAFSATVDCEAVIESNIDTSPFTPKGSKIQPSLQAVSAVLALRPESARRLQTEQNAPLRFKAFDLPSWDGQDFRKKKLCERLPYLGDFLAAIKSTPAAPYFEVPPTQLYAKKLFFDRVLAKGGEGCMFKNLNSPYVDSSKRSRKGWIKVKRSVELDAFVSGFEPGKPNGRWRNRVATLLFSVDTEDGPHLIAKVSSISKRSRSMITVKDKNTKEISLHPDMIGKTARLVGMEITPKSLRLLHPKVVRWNHTGVDAKTRCTYSMKDIRTGQMALPLIKPAAPEPTRNAH
jgi:ATP-dependent DNA ligase